MLTFANGTSEVFNCLLPIPDPDCLDAYVQDVQWALWRPLFFQGVGGDPIIDEKSSLAFPPVWSDGNTTVTIRLKPGLKWSDGTPVTTRDIEFFFNLYAADKTQSAYYVPGQFPDNVRSIDYVSSTEFVMHLTHTYSQQWYDDNQLTIIVPMPQQVWDIEKSGGPVGDYDLTPAGAKTVFKYLSAQSASLSTYATNPLWKVVDGPFRLTAYDPATYRTVLSANRSFVGPYKPYLSQVVIENFTSAAAEVDALRAGSIDYGWIPIADYNGLKGYFESHGYTVAPWAPEESDWGNFNFTSPKWGPLIRQLYIRQALQHLVNEQLYMTSTLDNLGQYTYGPVPNLPGSPFVSLEERTDPDPYSTTAARQLLTSHGWQPGKGGVMACADAGTGAGDCGAGITQGESLAMPLTYETGAQELMLQVEAFQTAASRAGIGITLNPESTGTMTSDDGVCPQSPPCNWAISIYAVYFWSFGDPDVEPTGGELFQTGNFWGGGYSSVTANALIEDTETKTGLQYMYAYENYISRQVAGLWWPTEDYKISVVKDNIGGWEPQQVFTSPRWEQWYYEK